MDLADAQSLGLVSVINGNFRTSADDTTVLTGGAGRKSVRLESKDTYDVHVTVYVSRRLSFRLLLTLAIDGT